VLRFVRCLHRHVVVALSDPVAVASSSRRRWRFAAAAARADALAAGVAEPDACQEQRGSDERDEYREPDRADGRLERLHGEEVVEGEAHHRRYCVVDVLQN